MDLFFKDAIKQTQNIERKVEQVGNLNISVVGVGGCGNNIINWISKQKVQGAKIFALNTDQQHLNRIEADEKLLIGKTVTRGLGCGGNPLKGEEAARESSLEIKEMVNKRDIVFVITGNGGGTGSGAAPVVAELARKSGSLVFGVATMPFNMERLRVEKAEVALLKLKDNCDCLIVIDNNKLTEIAGSMPLGQAFNVANNLISTMVKGLIETITVPSLINLDYADLRAIATNSGIASIGVGSSNTKNRVSEAVNQAINNPLLEVDYDGATGALINIQGGPEMTLEEVNNAIKMITQKMDKDANVIFGAKIDEKLKGQFIVMSIITGLKSTWDVKKEEKRDNFFHSLDIDTLKKEKFEELSKQVEIRVDNKSQIKEERKVFASVDYESLDLSDDDDDLMDESLEIQILN